MAIKIDLAKAYDRLRWEFIRDTLFEMKLPPLLLEIIMQCVTTPSMKILWNSEPTQEFVPSRGIRQSDPLSTYLFVMCMERLNHLIESSAASRDQAHAIKGCLQRFCDASGEIVSFLKSHIYFSKNVPDECANEVSGILGIDHTDDLSYYMGMPIINGRGSSDEDKKIHMVSWNTLQKDRKEGGLGIRSIRQANAAFPNKLGWRMLAELTSLWSQILRSKYCKGRCDLDMFPPIKNSSNATEILFSSMITTPIPIEAQDKTIEEYWNINGTHNGGWNWEELSTFLSHETLKIIASHSVSPSHEDEDFMYWGGSSIL
ncbi:putative ribonuclease H protein [Tanacetum coccineum]